MNFLNLRESGKNNLKNEEMELLWKPKVVFYNTKERLKTIVDGETSMEVERMGNFTTAKNKLPQVLHRLQNKEKPIRTTFTLRFGSLKMIFECSIARCDVGLGRAIVQCQKNPLRKPKLSINRAILSAHFSAVKFCIGFFCWIGFFWFCIGFFCNWMLQLLLKIVAKNLNYASLHVCT